MVDAIAHQRKFKWRKEVSDRAEFQKFFQYNNHLYGLFILVTDGKTKKRFNENRFWDLMSGKTDLVK